MFSFFTHKHNWHYALGKSNGIISGEPREICLRRFCPDGAQHQYTETYTSAARGLDNELFFADPVWTDGFEDNVIELNVRDEP